MEKGLLLFIVFPLLISAALGAFLVLYIARRRPVPGSRALMALILAATIWAIGYALEILIPGLENKQFWAKFQYFGIATIPLLWFIFADRRMGTPDWLAHWSRYIWLLAIIPLLTLILVWTNEVHGLVWQEVHIQAVGPVEVLGIEHGAWFWFNLMFSYLLLLVGSVWLLRGLAGTVRLYRWQIILAIIAVLIPWIANLVYITPLNPIEHVDWTPFAFILAGLLFTIGLFRFQFINILPIAQRSVFAGLTDCVLVLDLEDRVEDLNLAARKNMVNPDDDPVGKPLAEVAPALAPWLAKAGLEAEFRFELEQGDEPDLQFYDVRISPLTGASPQPLGRLVVCHEITPLKREQQRLEQARQQLEQTVALRTEDLRTTVEQLQVELAERSLAEKRFKDVFEAAPDAMLLVDQNGMVILANAHAERLSGYTRDELVGLDSRCLVSVEAREQFPGFLQERIEKPAFWTSNVVLNILALHKDGSQFPAEVSLGSLQTAGGIWIACNIRDVTQRNKTEAEKNRLMEEIEQSRQQLSALTIRLQEVQEAERRQIASDLHDLIGQNLTGLNLNLQIIENELADGCSDPVRGRLRDSLKLLEETARHVRTVMVDLRPPVLEEFGLIAALKWYGANFTQRTGIAVQMDGDGIETYLSRDEELVLFRMVQEALNNVAKHSRATRVEITLAACEAATVLQIRDDGRGFNPQALDALSEEPHWGLISMEQRAASIGGQLSIDSAPGQGTLLTVEIRRAADDN